METKKFVELNAQELETVKGGSVILFIAAVGLGLAIGSKIWH